MTYTLDVWYYRDDDTDGAKTPASVTSRSELEELLEYMLAHRQPHPPQVVARERPRVGPRQKPDTLIKVDVAFPERMGALMFLSPKSWEPPAADGTPQGIYVTRNESPSSNAPTLFIDKDVRAEFPPNAALPVDRILAALEEFRQTGELPTCVTWQDHTSEFY
ncbi:Imm1 family immunity protein [Lentzea sp. JNUCC 0626]|uniref:Imm1 family immunity protein n=1 Tax=Lentzea sp. JNUCC 0626 TaxID=3367513 RepID=UPI003748B6FC